MQTILILDYGSRHLHMLARKVRQCHVYCEILPGAGITAERIRQIAPLGIILTGDSRSVHDPDCPLLSKEIYEMGLPILGLGFGCEMIVHQMGGIVTHTLENKRKDFSRTLAVLDPKCLLYLDFIPESVVWMEKGDVIQALPEGFREMGYTMANPVVAFEDRQRQLFGLQFHPEAPQTEGGIRMLRAFLYGVCRAREEWNMEAYVPYAVEKLRSQIGNRKVLLALSGGVASSVLAGLLDRAVGRQMTCVFVDHGMLRLGEADKIEAVFGKLDLNFVRINAQDRFFARLAGITDPAEKRRVIGEEFTAIFQEEARKVGPVEIFAQGTTYTDLSVTPSADSQGNYQTAGGVPVDIDFVEILEPLKDLFKEEVRELGLALGLLEEWMNIQPFPGPGMAVRVVGEVTPEKVALLQKADLIYRRELERSRMQVSLGQYFAVLTNSPSTSMASGGRTCGHTLALRAVSTDDYLTAKWARLPYEVLDRVSQLILTQVPQISRIVYDITSKPPATIEWM